LYHWVGSSSSSNVIFVRFDMAQLSSLAACGGSAVV
jgi:hypothetical protein